ncbi:Uu.00g055510.m01.CDS01 [Anthostomella pinea]|uniref:Uu.00g055510.m01.CDS01 n=1 Tax=Anthostomella pinea TaxID=933095 RepID=A0AAI8VR43_9PEZI|nr:Uu.00g055510.m01.CDS01 [Anthostomella pinea]
MATAHQLQISTREGEEKLAVDILYRVRKHFLRRPFEVYPLAPANRRLWNALRIELYIADIQYAKVNGHETALHWSITNGLIDQSDMLIDLAQRFWPDYINARDMDDSTALHIAA